MPIENSYRITKRKKKPKFITLLHLLKKKKRMYFTPFGILRSSDKIKVISELNFRKTKNNFFSQTILSKAPVQKQGFIKVLF